MNKNVKTNLCVALCAVTALSACACSTAQPESTFDSPRPWQDDIKVALDGSYEKLDYAVAVYDTTGGATDDKRVKIADGKMTFALSEPVSGDFTTLEMSFSVTYAADAPAPDAGLTDTIVSRVLFSTNSLAAKEMQKTVTLADRDGVQNLSYELTADYFGTHEATFRYIASDEAARTLALKEDTCHDNEMLFFLARAQTLAPEGTTMFRTVNIFDSFYNGKLTEYTMLATNSAELVSLDIGDWVKDFGIEAVTDEQSGETTYPVPCYNTSVGINAERHGPPYVVNYAEKPFVRGEKSHAKLPIRIGYSQYENSRAFRYTEYTLTACSFDRAK